MLQWYDEKRGIWVEDTSCRFMLDNGMKCNAKFLALLCELELIGEFPNIRKALARFVLALFVCLGICKISANLQKCRILRKR